MTESTAEPSPENAGGDKYSRSAIQLRDLERPDIDLEALQPDERCALRLARLVDSHLPSVSESVEASVELRRATTADPSIFLPSNIFLSRAPSDEPLDTENERYHTYIISMGLPASNRLALSASFAYDTVPSPFDDLSGAHVPGDAEQGYEHPVKRVLLTIEGSDDQAWQSPERCKSETERHDFFAAFNAGLDELSRISPDYH